MDLHPYDTKRHNTTRHDSHWISTFHSVQMVLLQKQDLWRVWKVFKPHIDPFLLCFPLVASKSPYVEWCEANLLFNHLKSVSRWHICRSIPWLLKVMDLLDLGCLKGSPQLTFVCTLFVVKHRCFLQSPTRDPLLDSYSGGAGASCA
jgi:hypothetical protein